MSDRAEVAEGIAAVLVPALGEVEISGLERLSAGASRETWSFDAIAGGEAVPLVMQRARGGAAKAGQCTAEANVLRHAHDGGVTVPEVLVSGEAPNPLDRDFTIVRRLGGESIARKILRDDTHAVSRERFVDDCARELAAIHALDPEPMAGLLSAVDDPLGLQRLAYESLDDPHPVFDLALRWLAENRPQPVATRIVHGDFRMGNLLVGVDGIEAVLDWELCHLGDSRSDLGWLCARAWRFGGDGEVGGVGSRSELLERYASHGGRETSLDELRWWEVMATLRWGSICMVMVDDHRRGRTKSVELAMIGRRVAEVEYDTLLLLPELVA